MQVKQLAEREANEAELASRLMSRVGKPRERKISILDFYPEFGGLENSLYAPNIPYLVDRRHTRIEPTPVFVLLPFYERLVIGIEPLKDHQTFERWYGLSTDEIVELVISRRAHIRLSSPTLTYANLDYLDPILGLNPPTVNRAEAFTRALAGTQGLEGLERSFDGVGLQYARLDSTRDLSDLRSHFRPEQAAQYLEAIRMQYLRLGALGYGALLQKLSREASGFLSFASMLRTYYVSLAAPFYHSLEGIHVLSGGSVRESFPRGEAFPMDVGRFLVNRLELVKPRSLEHAIDLFPDFQSARRALFSLNKALTTPTSNQKLVDRRLALESAWNEASQIERRTVKGTTIAKYVGVVGSVVLGALAAETGFPEGILVGLGAAVAESRLARPTAAAIAKLGKPTHIVDLYDLSAKAQSWHMELHKMGS